MIAKTTLQPPPLRYSQIEPPVQKYFLTLQNAHPMVEIDTTLGNYNYPLPAAGFNPTTGQTNQNAEYVVTKTSSDANTVTITGAASGTVILANSGDFARFKSNGAVWRRVG